MNLAPLLLAVAAPPALIPAPAKLEAIGLGFALGPQTRISAPTVLLRTAQLLQQSLAGTGLPLEIVRRPGANMVNLRLDPKLSGLGDEGYRLEVRTDRVEIHAFRPAGAFYGTQTLRQLLPAAAFRKGLVAGEWAVPGVRIEDRPRFGWRGAHVDVARHFMPKEFLLKFIDLLALHKMNRLHLHLTDDQGWRMEIKRYPRLTIVGAWREDSMLEYDPPRYSGKPHGGFYTQDDLREVVAYAAERHIDVMPEIEMPGHAQAAIAAYPELGNTDQPVKVGTRWGVYDHVFNVEDSTIKFLQDVLDEVLAVFPSKFIHIGGDEVPKTQWKQSPRAQARIKELGLKDEEELQSWFIRQMDKYLDAKGRRLVGWDEILEGGLAEGATVMSWRGISGGIAAAKMGHDVVMAPTSHTYFDYYQSRKPSEPKAIGGYVPWPAVLGFEPVPPDLSAEEGKRVLGAQFQLWSEYIPNSRHMEYMAYPRGCALAEVVWSPAGPRDVDEFRKRLEVHLERLRALDVNFRPLDPPDPPPVARWKPGELSEEWTERTWDATPAFGAPGEYLIRFQYEGGACRLDFRGVRVLVDGVEVAASDQAGRTGGDNLNNVVRLRLPRIGKKVAIVAQVRTDGGTDSSGGIWVERA